jgi:GH18 family chitinase
VDFVTKYDLDGLDIDYEHPNDPKDVSSNKSVHNYLEAGVKPNKIILGVPFYGNWLVQRLGGMMFWEYTGDPDNSLLNAINGGLHPHAKMEP